MDNTESKKPTPAPERPHVSPAKRRKRHNGLIVSFIICCIIPIFVIAYYLFAVASDQYSSKLGFSVRSEEASQISDFFGAFGSVSGASASDTDILYEFIKSQHLVQSIDEKLDLRSIYSSQEHDWYFAFDETGSIEDLHEYWNRMIKVNYEPGTGLIEVVVKAFDPQNAKMIADEILRRCSKQINELAAISRDDTTKYAKADLEKAVERLKEARVKLTTFRNKHQIIDPYQDAQIQSTRLTSLENSRSELQVDRALLISNSGSNDTRLKQVNKRIKILDDFIEEERSKIGVGAATGAGTSFSSVVGEFEALTVDREFAEQSYVSSLASYDGAVAEAQRQNRYLAAYILPSEAQKSLYPKRLTILFFTIFILFGSWSIMVLVYYSLKDRR